MADKIDFKKTMAGYRAPKGRFQIMDVPEVRYLMLDGHGDPNSSPTFAEAIEALYPVAYKLKFASKDSLGRDYVVPPLEGLWWADDLDAFTTARDKSTWDWTLMLMVPDWIDPELFTACRDQAFENRQRLRVLDVRLESLAEGRVVQTLHVGSFDDESEVLGELHGEFLPAHRIRAIGKHHEIYLSDFRKVAPERQRTILRQPIASEHDE